MRISARRDDPGYANFRGPCNVYLDGVLQLCVLAVDVEEGYVELIARDSSGIWLHNNGEFGKERKTGVVRIEPMGAAPAASPEPSAADVRVAAKRELRRFF